MLDPEIVFLSPDGLEWNPHSDVYAKNEEQFFGLERRDGGTPA